MQPGFCAQIVHIRHIAGRPPSAETSPDTQKKRRAPGGRVRNQYQALQIVVRLRDRRGRSPGRCGHRRGGLPPLRRALPDQNHGDDQEQQRDDEPAKRRSLLFAGGRRHGHRRIRSFHQKFRIAGKTAIARPFLKRKKFPAAALRTNHRPYRCHGRVSPPFSPRHMAAFATFRVWQNYT